MQVWCDFLFCRPGTIIHIMNVVYLYWYRITCNLKKHYKCEILNIIGFQCTSLGMQFYRVPNFILGVDLMREIR